MTWARFPLHFFTICTARRGLGVWALLTTMTRTVITIIISSYHEFFPFSLIRQITLLGDYCTTLFPTILKLRYFANTPGNISSTWNFVMCEMYAWRESHAWRPRLQTPELHVPAYNDNNVYKLTLVGPRGISAHPKRTIGERRSPTTGYGPPVYPVWRRRWRTESTTPRPRR